MEETVFINTNSTGEASVVQKNEANSPSKRLNFSDPTQRDAHIQTFLTWLPAAFHDAPGLEWSHLPSRVMGYLIACATDNPDVLPIVLAVGCAMNSMKSTTLLTYCGRLTRLLRQLRTKANMKNVAELGTHHIWDRFVAGRTLS